jgi:hypothetical protein
MTTFGELQIGKICRMAQLTFLRLPQIDDGTVWGKNALLLPSGDLSHVQLHVEVEPIDTIRESNDVQQCAACGRLCVDLGDSSLATETFDTTGKTKKQIEEWLGDNYLVEVYPEGLCDIECLTMYSRITVDDGATLVRGHGFIGIAVND